ncbi:MAG: hypothetical protein J5685_07915 [Clostridiales bacterium]|nr:hypothetical protein [Clostridiales bacterium]
MNNNINAAPAKSNGLTIYSIICLVVLYGGLACSYIFWKNCVDDQFGLFIPFTVLFLILLNIIFKIPSIVDVILLGAATYRFSRSGDTAGRKTSILFMTVIVVSDLICICAEFVMFISTRGSSLG